MRENLEGIILMVIGCCLIIFRKGVAELFIRKQIIEREELVGEETPKTKKVKEDFQKLKEMKLEGVLHKGLEIVSIAAGIFLILMSAAEFFPQAGKYIGYFIAYFLLAFFAACAAGLVELEFIAPFLMRGINKYKKERDNQSWIAKHSSGSDGPDDINTGPINDPILRSLQRKFLIYLVVSFVVLFAIFLSAVYTIFILTS